MSSCLHYACAPQNADIKFANSAQMPVTGEMINSSIVRARLQSKPKQWHLYSLELDSNDPEAELPSESKLIKLPVVAKLLVLLLTFRLATLDWPMCESGFFDRFRSTAYEFGCPVA